MGLLKDRAVENRAPELLLMSASRTATAAQGTRRVSIYVIPWATLCGVSFPTISSLFPPGTAFLAGDLLINSKTTCNTLDTRVAF
jgi:hypothetical protein